MLNCCGLIPASSVNLIQKHFAVIKGLDSHLSLPILRKKKLLLQHHLFLLHRL